MKLRALLEDHLARRMKRMKWIESDSPDGDKKIGAQRMKRMHSHLGRHWSILWSQRTSLYIVKQ